MRTWGAFETALLRSVTDQISALPSASDAHRLVTLVVSVLPYIGELAIARMLPAVKCLELTSTPLSAADR